MTVLCRTSAAPSHPLEWGPGDAHKFSSSPTVLMVKKYAYPRQPSRVSGRNVLNNNNITKWHGSCFVTCKQPGSANDRRSPGSKVRWRA
ncbi:MAG: hypothetical protein RLN77_03810, partial [Rhodospirillales bacterium]